MSLSVSVLKYPAIKRFLSELCISVLIISLKISLITTNSPSKTYIEIKTTIKCMRVFFVEIESNIFPNTYTDMQFANDRTN